MFLGPGLSFFMESIQVGVELIPVDPPHAPAPELDGRQVSRTNQGIDLRNADTQVIGYVFERQVSRLESGLCWLGALGSALRRGHLPKIAPGEGRYLDLVSFAAVWSGD